MSNTGSKLATSLIGLTLIAGVAVLAVSAMSNIGTQMMLAILAAVVPPAL